MQRASWESSCIMLLAEHSASPTPVITFLLSAKSALHAVDEPPADVLSSPHYHCFCVATHVASLIAATSLQATPSKCMLALWLYYTCMKTMPCPKKCVCSNCILVVLLTYIHTHIHTYDESPCITISCFTSRSAIKGFFLLSVVHTCIEWLVTWQQ